MKKALPQQCQYRSSITLTETQDKSQNQKEEFGKLSKFIAELRGLGKKKIRP